MIGSVIAGRYTLAELIGEGGMGIVYRASQTEPLRRPVALKLIKPGMDSRQVLARFDAERQALAMMDHPNIARVYDGGSTDAGQPFFVMELVAGAPITRYADEHHLPVRARLELFVSVCRAVQHAHQKGVIHRDLKPTNVLVAEVDGRPVPKVIDFGVAKAVEQRLTDLSLADTGAVVGTPAYMSPEQADPTTEDIDTRTDVYALGVMLYELLVGSPPIDARQFRRGAILEMLRMVREEEPPRPSTKLSTAADRPNIAANRATEPAQLARLLQGELDWVVMKALEKDRTRRYETANGLARDVQRYLADEVVEARPPSRGYRLKKFVRRNRAGVTAAGLVALALVLGFAGTVYGLREALRARDGEAVARVAAQAESERALAAEAETRKRAAELKLVADFQGRLLAQVDPAAAGVRLTEDIRKRFAAALAKDGVPDDGRGAQVDAFAGQWGRVNATDTALGLIDDTILKPAAAAIDAQFADQPVVAAALRHVLAERYHDLGLDAAALALEERTLADRRRVLGDDHPETLLSIGNAGAYLSALGKSKEAEQYYREALERSRRVRGEDDPETLVCVDNLGTLLREAGKPGEAEPYYREALDKRRRVLGEEHPDTLRSVDAWGLLLRDQGKLAEAEPYYREALDKRRRVLGEGHRDTINTTNNLAAVLKDQGKLDDAVVQFRGVVAARRRILGDVHPSTLNAIQNLGATLDAAGQSAEAEGLLREALATRRRVLGADHPDTLVTLGNLTVFLIGQNKLAEAEPLCRETLERRRRVLGTDNQMTLVAYNVMGLVLVRQNKVDEGEPYWREALAIARRVRGPAHPDTLVYAHNLARLMLDQKKADEAEQLFREVVRAGGPAVGAGHPTVLSAARQLSGILLEQKRYADAAELLSPAEAAARKTYTGSSERSLGSFLENLGRARARLGQFAPAEANLLEAHAIYAKTRGPTHADSRNCTRLLVEFYTLWDKAEPGQGYDAKAAAWKARLPTEQAPPPRAKG
jgi:tetratricopeptide (TPR) repeat protein